MFAMDCLLESFCSTRTGLNTHATRTAQLVQLYYDTDGAGKWVVSESINQGQPLLIKASAQSCPHTDDGVPWKYRSTKGRVENDDPSLDLGCGKRRKKCKI